MNSLYANVINETEKIFLKKKTLIWMISAAAVPAVTAGLFSFIQGKMGSVSIVPSNFSTMMLGIFTSIFLPLFILSASCDIFAGENGDNTIKIVLTRPITRFKVYLSKNISIGILVLVYLIILFVSSTISGLFAGVSRGILSNMKSYAAAIIPMLSVGIFASFLSQFFKSSSSALTVGVFVYIASKIIQFVFPKAARLLLFNYTDWHMLWLGGTAGAGNILTAFMFILSYSIIFFSAGFYLFDIKDI